jgi:activating signal cointegrator complex subunit 2
MASEEVLPLNQQQRERVDPHTGCKDVVPALDPSWCKEVEFLSYVPPPPPAGEGEDSDLSVLWLEALELMDSDLRWLLLQSHQRFWCQVIYDTTLHKMLDSYLRYGPRPHEATPPITLRGREVMARVHRRVFMTFLRMSTHKESPSHFLLEDSFGDIIYNNFLFDITRLLDLCSLYHTSNHALLAKMVANVFARQPHYQDDLKSVLNSVLNLLDQVTEECHGNGGGERGRKGEAVKLKDIHRQGGSEVAGVLGYVGDIAYSLRHFMDVYPPSVPLAVEAGLLDRLVVFYGEAVPPLQKRWLTLKNSLDPRKSVMYSCVCKTSRLTTILIVTDLRAVD